VTTNTQTIRQRTSLPKAPTGVVGLDQVTEGGLPRGRATLVCGPAGSGKTLLALEFLMRGIVQFGEPGVFLSFEEAPEDLVANVGSLGFDLDELAKQEMLILDHVSVTHDAVEEGGEWDLEGLFLRLGSAISTIGARRVVIDTIENLFGALPNAVVLRSELHRLFGWLKTQGVTTVITGERGEGTLTRQGIEEYVSDCVIVLDHRVVDQSSTRRLRIVKYRGSLHGTNEYPFLIGRDGLSVLPITTVRDRYPVSTDRVSSGVVRLDEMLGHGGYYRGSSIVVSGSAGTGKSTLGAQFCAAACARGERALYFAFEETEEEIVRNMQSVGIDLQPALASGLLHFICARPSRLGLEAHLLEMQQVVAEMQPAVVVVDPVSDLLRIGTEADVVAMITRELDFMKARGITALFTVLSAEGWHATGSGLMASLVDTWLVAKFLESAGEHNRMLYVRKARGMAHSHQIRELLLSSEGIDLADVYVGPHGPLTGSARMTHEAHEAHGVSTSVRSQQPAGYHAARNGG
jgi:circadian clock protein KaiC